MVAFSPTPPPSAQGHPVLPVPMAGQPQSKCGAREWERRSSLVMVQTSVLYTHRVGRRKGGKNRGREEDNRSRWKIAGVMAHE